jgi:hypothetical protein
MVLVGNTINNIIKIKKNTYTHGDKINNANNNINKVDSIFYFFLFIFCTSFITSTDLSTSRN